MPFISRGVKRPRKHVCKTPFVRFVPWPRWRAGAVWQCGERNPNNGQGVPVHKYRNGCGRKYRWVGYPWDAWQEMK